MYQTKYFPNFMEKGFLTGKRGSIYSGSEPQLWSQTTWVQCFAVPYAETIILLLCDLQLSFVKLYKVCKDTSKVCKVIRTRYLSEEDNRIYRILIVCHP